MTQPSAYEVRQLVAGEAGAMRRMLAMFGEAFEDRETYMDAQPTDAYLEGLLGGDSFVAVAAFDGDAVVAGLAAYELKKFERERSEFYIYDLAVAKDYRRQGLATALIERLRSIVVERGAYVIFVQADLTDPPAIALYTKLGTREDVLHFDIEVAKREEGHSDVPV